MFLNLTLLFTRLFSDPLRPSELTMCLGNLSQAVFDVLSHRTSVFLLTLFICLENRPLILSKYNRLKVFTAVQRKKTLKAAGETFSLLSCGTFRVNGGAKQSRAVF